MLVFLKRIGYIQSTATYWSINSSLHSFIGLSFTKNVASAKMRCENQHEAKQHETDGQHIVNLLLRQFNSNDIFITFSVTIFILLGRGNKTQGK